MQNTLLPGIDCDDAARTATGGACGQRKTPAGASVFETDVDLDGFAQSAIDPIVILKPPGTATVGPETSLVPSAPLAKMRSPEAAT